MPGDMSVLEQRVYPLLQHTAIYIRHLHTTGKPTQAMPFKVWCYEMLSYTRKTYHRALKHEERRQLGILCEKLFSALPQRWQRIGLPPTTPASDDDEYHSEGIF
jgi:hypothetical protein